MWTHLAVSCTVGKNKKIFLNNTGDESSCADWAHFLTAVGFECYYPKTPSFPLSPFVVTVVLCEHIPATIPLYFYALTNNCVGFLCLGGPSHSFFPVIWKQPGPPTELEKVRQRLFLQNDRETLWMVGWLSNDWHEINERNSSCLFSILKKQKRSDHRTHIVHLAAWTPEGLVSPKRCQDCTLKLPLWF